MPNAPPMETPKTPQANQFPTVSSSINRPENHPVSDLNNERQGNVVPQTKELTRQPKSLTMNVEALTVPVTIDPIIPVFENQRC